MELRAPTNREPIAAGGARSVCCSKSSCDTSVGRHNVFEPVLIVDARVSLEPFGFKAWLSSVKRKRDSAQSSSTFNIDDSAQQFLDPEDAFHPRPYASSSLDLSPEVVAALPPKPQNRNPEALRPNKS